MMNTFHTFLLIIFSLTLPAQEFSFDLYFEDAVGNKDTLTLGYDSLATRFIDTAFGEQNIVSKTLVAPFDVRVTDEMERRSMGPQNTLTATFHTKKQIVHNDCDERWFSVIDMNVYCENWPISVTWDKRLFDISCRIGTFLTPITPEIWADSPFPLVHLSRQAGDTLERSDNDAQNSYTREGKWIQVFWLMVRDEKGFVISNNEIEMSKEKLRAFPNPSHAQLTVSLNVKEENMRNTSIEIRDLNGRLCMSDVLIGKSKTIDVSGLSKGLYFISVSNDAFQETKKMVID